MMMWWEVGEYFFCRSNFLMVELMAELDCTQVLNVEKNINRRRVPITLASSPHPVPAPAPVLCLSLLVLGAFSGYQSRPRRGLGQTCPPRQSGHASRALPTRRGTKHTWSTCCGVGSVSLDREDAPFGAVATIGRAHRRADPRRRPLCRPRPRPRPAARRHFACLLCACHSCPDLGERHLAFSLPRKHRLRQSQSWWTLLRPHRH